MAHPAGSGHGHRLSMDHRPVVGGSGGPQGASKAGTPGFLDSFTSHLDEISTEYLWVMEESKSLNLSVVRSHSKSSSMLRPASRTQARGDLVRAGARSSVGISVDLVSSSADQLSLLSQRTRAMDRGTNSLGCVVQLPSLCERSLSELTCSLSSTDNAKFALPTLRSSWRSLTENMEHGSPRVPRLLTVSTLTTCLQRSRREEPSLLL